MNEKKEQKAGRPKLTDEEIAKKREEKKIRLKLQLAKLAKTESSEARKKRTRELIEIGAIISQYHDRTKLLEYLKEPRFGCWDVAGTSWNLVGKGPYKIGDEVSSETKKSTIKRLFIDLKHVPE